MNGGLVDIIKNSIIALGIDCSEQGTKIMMNDTECALPRNLKQKALHPIYQIRKKISDNISLTGIYTFTPAR